MMTMNTCIENNVLQELLKLLKLEKIEENIFRSAASQTVPPSRRAHSLHAYFLRMGDATRPIVYEVDCIRDGRSFTTRRVVAIQKGRAIFNMSASFQIDEPGFDHQDSAPQVPGPDGIESELVLARKVADKIPAAVRDKILCKKPLEIRPVNPINPFAPEKKDPIRYSWFRAIDKMPDDPAVHQYMLAYASDYGLVITSLYPHGHSYWDPDMQVASLDHAMWFHRDFRMDDWLLSVVTSPNAYKARGLNNGKIFTRDGKLVASVTQEGLIRYRAMKK
jgi:acyl-CoA thioesterase-2